VIPPSDPSQSPAHPHDGDDLRRATARGGWRRRRLSLALAAAVVAADQLSKSWAAAVLAAGSPRPLLPGLLELTFTTNTGAAFSLFTGSTAALAIISLMVATLVLVLILRSAERSMPLTRQLALGFLLGGAVGNGIDRWRLGAVIDFLALVPVSFPVFNLADVAINLAVACFAIELVRPPQRGDG